MPGVSDRSATSDKPDELPQYGFLFDQKRCNGCKTCEVACKDYHGLEDELAFRTIYEYTGGTWTQDENGAWSQDVFCYHLSISCNHCENPVCVRCCTSHAIEKGRFGFVEIDGQLCVGCQTCMIACPYHAPRFDERRGIAVKCDGCGKRIAEGKQPICVEACPRRALSMEAYDDIASIPGCVSALAPLPASAITQPHLVILPCEIAQEVQLREGTIINLREA